MNQLTNFGSSRWQNRAAIGERIECDFGGGVVSVEENGAEQLIILSISKFLQEGEKSDVGEIKSSYFLSFPQHAFFQS